ncbi:MAG: sigma-70 family RNA polymerase sigma factor [Planctomycetaceae bacterium]|nr:sigma-70 family RNA polymerase sigma factor [Planctomycetaceae bacterium]
MGHNYESDAGVRWMLAYQKGDERAFDRIVETYSGQLFALFTRFLGPAPEREDLVQDVFLRVIRARERYQPTARFSTWLYRIAFNIAVNRTQRGTDEASLDDGLDDEGPAWAEISDERIEAPTDVLERGDVVAAVRVAIAGLPKAQRMALILAKYDEMPYAEIAVVLRSSEKAIKSMVHRARENLRERLAPFLQQEEAP